MVKEFEPVTQELLTLINAWEPKLLGLPGDVITQRRNVQDRTVKMIVGHMVDSASNNTHRTVHMQYQASPLKFPNYATKGNNDRWIAIQNYQDEDWTDLVQLWKYSHLHFVHVVANVNPDKLRNEWDSESEHGYIPLKGMIIDFLRHFKLHLGEIDELLNAND